MRLAAALFLLILVAPFELRAEPCRIESSGLSLDDVVVHPAGGEPFTLRLRKLPADALPGAAGKSELRVHAPLRFTTTHDSNALGVRLRKETPLFGGRLVLASGLQPRVLDAKKDADQEDIALALPLDSLVLGQELRLPCKALDLAQDLNDYWEPELELSQKAIDHITPSRRFPLYREPEAVDPLWIDQAGPLPVVARRPGWIRVRSQWSDGSILQGWLPSSLFALRHEVPLHGLRGHMLGGLSGCGRSHGPFVSTFVIEAHAPIHSEPGGPIWAHTADRLRVQALTLSRSDGWVQIAEIDGLPAEPCSEHEHMWVHARFLVWTPKPLD